MEYANDTQRQVAELKKRVAELERIPAKIIEALHSDLEHGVKSLNEKAAREFKENYPELAAAINSIPAIFED